MHERNRPRKVLTYESPPPLKHQEAVKQSPGSSCSPVASCNKKSFPKDKWRKNNEALQMQQTALFCTTKPQMHFRGHTNKMRNFKLIRLAAGYHGQNYDEFRSVELLVYQQRNGTTVLTLGISMIPVIPTQTPASWGSMRPAGLWLIL